MTIAGTNFAGTTAVDFGSSPAATFLVDLAHLDQRHLPGRPGRAPVAITVTTPSGTNVANPAAQYTYEAAPTVAAVSPGAGLPAGATQVTITGTNFTGAIAVEFGSSSTAIFSVTSPTSITATSPADLAGGTVDVTVTTPVGTSAANPPADWYTYEAPPTVTAPQPEGRLAGRGHAVTITGTGFSAASAVDFGAVAASSFTVASPTSVTAALSPVDLAGGAVDVTVVSPRWAERHLCRRPVHLRGRAPPSPPSARWPACRPGPRP